MQRLALLLLLLIASAGAHSVTLTDADIAQWRSAPDIQIQLRHIERSAQNRETDRLVALADRVLNDPTQEAAARELLLASTANALATLRPTAASEQILAALTAYPTQVWLDHEHAGAATRIPAFDVAAAARFALDRHALERDVAALTARLNDRTATSRWAHFARPPGDALRRPKAAPALRAAVATRAAQALEQAQLRETLPELLATLPGAPQLAGAAIYAAVTLRDPAPLLAVLVHGNNRDALNALRAAGALGDTALTLGVIDVAIERPDTASAALGALAAHVRRVPADTPLLLTWLDRTDTALAAAHAVAQLDRPDIALELGARLLEASDRQHATALALALSLMRNDAARAQLQAYVSASEGFPGLKRKLRAARPGMTP